MLRWAVGNSSGAGILEERGRQQKANRQICVAIGFLLGLLCTDGPRPQRKLPKRSPLAFVHWTINPSAPSLP